MALNSWNAAFSCNDCNASVNIGTALSLFVDVGARYKRRHSFPGLAPRTNSDVIARIKGTADFFSIGSPEKTITKATSEDCVRVLWKCAADTIDVIVKRQGECIGQESSYLNGLFDIIASQMHRVFGMSPLLGCTIDDCIQQVIDLCSVALDVRPEPDLLLVYMSRVAPHIVEPSFLLAHTVACCSFMDEVINTLLS